MKLHLQTIVDTIQMQTLPSDWQNFDLAKFSNKKTLFDYQQKGLENALKAIWKYYIDCKVNKEKFFKLYQNNGLTENLDYKLNGNKKLKIFEEYTNDYKIENNTIAFYHFINRMSFWMATGSGKTLVIVKLLELLGNLIENNQIPQKDILFLTYREDLIDQFKKHIDEFNNSNNSLFICLYNLKDYEKVKRDHLLKFRKNIDVFYYRSDLISDEQKDKIVNFRNYDNDGNWYILLDEAHKGDKEDSKRQLYYSILSRNGFLFNFSATFTDPVDFATCVFNFNLEKFIQEGYGKHIYISQSNIEAFVGKEEDTKLKERQKQLIILKILLLHTLIKNSMPEGFYHKPLILTLVNTVNKGRNNGKKKKDSDIENENTKNTKEEKDPDLELFFKEIAKIANDGVDDNLFQEAKTDLINDLQYTCEFDNEKIQFDNNQINNLTFNDILENVFNAKTKGVVEVLKIPGNKQEIIFKLKTSERPFALIKIGDISEWIKNKLSNYEINETFDNESVFRNINKDDSDINILMGSRAFYEGWDSNRPNIILYINIGQGTDAKKFVLQSIGRGVRIEPLPNKRKRLQFLYNNNEIEKNVFEEIKNNINLIETLFVYGTKAENLKEVIETLKEEKQEEIIGDLFEINPDIQDKLLLIPIYSESQKILADENYFIKFEINQSDLELTKNYFDYITDKVALVKFDIQPKILKKIKESFENFENNQRPYYKIDSSTATIAKPEILLKNISRHFLIKSKDFKEFKPLENEIIHFKQIRITEKIKEKLEQKIKQILYYKEKDEKLSEIAKKIQKEPQKASEYVKEIEEITHNYVKEAAVEYKTERVKLKYLKNHYYLPVALTETEKGTFLLHIIKTKSEVNFINELEEYLQKKNNFFEQFDWWFFCKIDETLDEVYIPYYQPKTNRIERFKPDFIFWLKKGNDYTILFIDPKGTEHTDGYRKIDGYSRIFEDENRQSRTYDFNDNKINVKLLLKTSNLADVTQLYQQYWFDNFTDFHEKIKATTL